MVSQSCARSGEASLSSRARRTLGFSQRDIRRVPFGPDGKGGTPRFRFLAAEKENVRMSLIKRAYRYRCSPTAEQRQVLARTFVCCRWVSNQALAKKITAYREAGQHLFYSDLSALLPVWKSQEETGRLAEEI